MATAVAAVLAVTISTAARLSPPGDGSWSAVAPEGYSLAPAAAPASLRFIDAAGNGLVVTALGPSTPLQLDAAAYDELKALETRLAAPGRECVSTPLRDLALSGGRGARSADGVCGAGGRVYSVTASSAGGRMFLVAADGLTAPAPRLLASVALPEVDSLFAVRARTPLAPLAPLPPRAHRTQLRIVVFAAFASFIAFLFLLRALPGLFARFFPPPDEPAAVPGSAFPVLARRSYGRLSFRYAVQLETGASFTAVSDRKPSVMISWGSALLAGYAVQSAAHADALLRGQTLFAAVILLVAGNYYLRRNPRVVRLLDLNDHPVIQVAEEEVSLTDPRGTISDDGGPTPYTLRRRVADGRRHWEILDAAGVAALCFVESSARRTKLRRAFGHLWGALRTEYELTAGGRVVGGLKRTWSVWNSFRLDIIQLSGLDPRVVAAAAVFIERVDPDRWHPWPV